jgi:hypothetical protein
MLQTSYDISTNLEPYIEEFSKVSTGINELYRLNLIEKINKGYTYLGIDNQAALKENKQNINLLAELFDIELALFNSALKFARRDSPNQYNTYVTSLELNKFKKPYSKESLMELALNVSQSLPEITSELIALKMPEEHLTKLTDLASNYIDAFKNQNSSRSRLTTVNDEQQSELNTICSEVKAISELAQTIFRRDRNKAKLFTISVIAKKYTQNRKRKTQDALPEDATPEATPAN